MSDKTAIEWTDATWSPTLGCERVSDGCNGCYAIRTVNRLAHNPNEKVATAAAGLTEYRDGRLDWTGQVRVLPDRLDLPHHWRRPRRIFVDAQSDLFHDDVSDEFIARVCAVMAATPQHTYQILTKRPARMRSLLNSESFWRKVAVATVRDQGIPLLRSGLLPNVWLGVSIEDQSTANLRVPILLETSAAVRFVSAEPLLGAVDLTSLQRRPDSTARINALSGDVWSSLSGEIYAAAPGCVDWVIVGGESGPNARPMHPDWARRLRDHTTNAGRAFLFKQWGEWAPAPWSVRICDPTVGWRGTSEELVAAKREAEGHGATHLIQPWGHLYEPNHKTWSMERDPEGDYPGAIRKWGKKLAGRELDGRTWDQYPISVRLHGEAS